MNVHHYASSQSYLDPYDMHMHHHQAPFTNVGLFELAPLLNSPASTSRSSFCANNSELSPGPSRHSDDTMSSTPTPPPSRPQMEPPAPSQSTETPVRRPGRPKRPSSVSAPVSEDRRDAVGRRRAPKLRGTTRPVQPVACLFCRRRKMACGPPVNLDAGDRTCQYVRPFVPLTLFLSLHTIICTQLRAHLSTTGGVLCPFFLSIFGQLVLSLLMVRIFVLVRPCARRRLVCVYATESFRGRQRSLSKAALGRLQQC